MIFQSIYLKKYVLRYNPHMTRTDCVLVSGKLGRPVTVYIHN